MTLIHKDTTNEIIYSPQDLLKMFQDWGYKTSTIEHEPLYTVEQSSYLADELPGAHCKSLFLKNKKMQYYLVVMTKFCKLDINALSSVLGSGRLSFASEERLWEKLRLIPGSVTPFGLISNSAKDVQLILDQEMMDYDLLNYHPLTNTMTTTIEKKDFLDFIQKTNHKPITMQLPRKHIQS